MMSSEMEYEKKIKETVSNLYFMQEIMPKPLTI